MFLNPYLNFNNQCEEALTFYAKVLDGKVDMLMRYGESPMSNDVPKEHHQRVMHAQLTIGSQIIMAADVLPEFCKDAASGNGGSIALTLNYEKVEDGQRVFDALAEGGKINMPFGPTFWAQGFGAVNDKFGTPWLVNGGYLPVEN